MEQVDKNEQVASFATIGLKYGCHKNVSDN